MSLYKMNPQIHYIKHCHVVPENINTAPLKPYRLSLELLNGRAVGCRPQKTITQPASKLSN